MWALPVNPVIFVMVSWMCNNAEDVKDATDTKNNSRLLYFTGLFDCATCARTILRNQRPRCEFTHDLAFRP